MKCVKETTKETLQMTYLLLDDVLTISELNEANSEKANLCMYCDTFTDNYEPDPFDVEVFGDDTPIHICDLCYDNRRIECS